MKGFRRTQRTRSKLNFWNTRGPMHLQSRRSLAPGAPPAEKRIPILHLCSIQNRLNFLSWSNAILGYGVSLLVLNPSQEKEALGRPVVVMGQESFSSVLGRQEPAELSLARWHKP